MNTVYMMIGIQGSGKTTYANMLKEKHGIKIMSSDGLRNERPDLEEKDVFPELYRRCAELLKEGKDLIYDATNITPGARMHLIEVLGTLGVDMSNVNVDAYYFIPNKELSKERVEKRNKMEGERFLPLDVIDNFFDRMVEPTKEEGFNKIIKINNDGKNFIVVEEI